MTTLLRAGALRLLALCGIAAAALALNGGNQPALAQTTADREWPGPPVPGVPRADEPVSDRVRHEDGSETWFYRCRHRSPNDLQEFVRRYVSSSGRVNHFAENNMLFIRDTPARLQFIERVLRRLDVARPQVLIEVKVISLTYSSDFELGFESSWNLDDKTAGNNQLFFRGFDLTFHPDAFLSALSANQGNKTAAQNDFRGTSIFFEAQGATRHRLGRLDATLRMLQEANQANIVARPAVLVEAGYEARIEAGQEVPIQYRTITNNVPIIGTEFKRVGVSLSLKPETIGEHTVRLTVKPELSSVVQFFDPGGLGLTNPIIRRTSASTSVTMQSRQTLELGGLRSSRTLIRQTGIPLLMDIPILGYLFRASKREQRRQDVVFFITPTILDGSDGRLTASLAREYEYFGSRTIDSPTHGGE